MGSAPNPAPGADADPTAWRDAAAVFALALGARLLLLPLFHDLSLAGDEEYYWRATGGEIFDYFVLSEHDRIHYFLQRPPLWPLLLTAVGQVFDGVLALRLVTVVLGSLAAALVAVLARDLFGRRTGLVAGILFAVYPEHVFFSHYLWAEVFFGLLCLGAAIPFFRYVSEPERGRGRLWAACLVAGLALLTKEFAGALFLGMAVTLAARPATRSIATLGAATAIFLAPFLLYVGWAFAQPDAKTLPLYAAVGNFREALGLEFRSAETSRSADVRELAGALAARGLGERVRATRHQLYNLWTPNSFPLKRLTPKGRKYRFSPSWAWGYGEGFSRRWFVPFVGFYAFAMVLGLAGLFLSDATPFRTFAVTCLVVLSGASVLALYVSRFRLPFMFLMIVYAAYALVRLPELWPRLGDWRRSVPLLLVLAVLTEIFQQKLRTLGQWG